MMEYLESFGGPIGREKFIQINPKYLFDEKLIPIGNNDAMVT